jgi:hypothetical protein
VGQSVNLLLRPGIVGVKFEDGAAVGYGLVDLTVRLIGRGQQVIPPDGAAMIGKLGSIIAVAFLIVRAGAVTLLA